MTQEIKRPAHFLAFSLTPPLSPMTPIDSSNGRACKSAKLSTERQPFFNLGYSSPSSCLKSRRQTISSSNNPSSGNLPPMPSTPSLPTITAAAPSSLSHSVERPAVKKAVFNVQFLPSEEYKPEGKAGYLPRTPYPLTREEEDERIFQSFLTALNEEE
ncbi:hypothetical protein BG015_011092 [Linnemannia schmuckeri]|uniref:Uncharacterized protein n=1 Tax=Linnemannia schmuckeri TaxID=64567 RepID=A0A9P5V8R7_9FUNG|nr:hypothetical protein BG015_011092 [Linnemannia schmuckeri]